MSQNVSVTFFENNEPLAAIVMPRSSSVEEVRRHGLQGQESGSPVFLRGSLNGPPLPEEGTLNDVLDPQEKAIFLHLVQPMTTIVHLVGSKMEKWPVQVIPGETVEGLTFRLKHFLGIDEGRNARLLRQGDVLKPGDPICLTENDPGVGLDLELSFLVHELKPVALKPPILRPFNKEIDLGIKMHLMETEADFQDDVDEAQPEGVPFFERPPRMQEVRLFASQTAMEIVDGLDWRLHGFDTETIIQGFEPISALATEEAIRTGEASVILAEQQMEITIRKPWKQGVKTKTVWPTSKLNDILKSSDYVLVDGEDVNADCSFLELGLLPGSCLYMVRYITVPLIDVNETIQQVRIDLGETLLAVKERLTFQPDAFELWSDDRLLIGDDRPMLHFDIKTTNLLTLRPKTRAVALQLGAEEPICIGQVRKTIPFEIFLPAAAAALETHLPPTTRFVCSCGRIFSDETPQRREFPLNCCSDTKIHFTVDFNLQTSEWLCVKPRFRIDLRGLGLALHGAGISSSNRTFQH